MNDKLRAHHLERKAILYVRQSSSYQVTHNEESRRLQYAMRNRLEELGWREIEVIDEDLGRSAAGTVARSGFERMVADVCLGKVGAVAAREVSRFARNSREWQQLVEVCRLVDTLLIDQDVIYAPRLSNDRLLLGLKGSLNEYELDLLRQRSLEARYEKARRGELVISAPVGFMKTEDQRLEKDPDRRVQERIQLVFQKFLEIGSVRQTLLWFREEDVQLPTRSANGEISWKRPCYASIHRILTHPAFGGAYTFGRTEPGLRVGSGEARTACRRRRPREQWIALIPGHHDGYVSWEQFEQIQAMILGNSPGPERPQAAKQGASLLAGLLRCRRCGRKLTVSYTGQHRDSLRYICQRGYLDNGESKCLSFGGVPVDKAMAREVLRVVQPAAVNAAVDAARQMDQQHDLALAALQRDLEAARYAVRRAQKQFDAADPENRLVVDELERRWNQALAQVQALEYRVEQHRGSHTCTQEKTDGEFRELAGRLQEVWNDARTDVRLKKRIVRTLLHEAVVDVDDEAHEVILTLHWQGGVHTELRLPRRRRGTATRTSADALEAVRILARVCPDEAIAGFLNRNNLPTGRGNRWIKERVTALRSYHGIPCHNAERQVQEGTMTLTAAAAFLGVSTRTLRLAAERGDIAGQHPLAVGPWVFTQSDLESQSARDVVAQARQRGGRDPAVPLPNQQCLGFSGT